MSHYRRRIACFLFCGVALHAFAEVEIKTQNYPGPYRPWSLEYQHVNPEDLYNINAEDLAKMTLDNPLLKYAYIGVFLCAVGHLDQSEPAQLMTLADMRRRGEAITPMLLKLANENEETGFEIRLLGMVDQVGIITLDPYLEYARELLQKRTQTMSATAAAVASTLIAKHGSEADVDLLGKVLEERPYVADDVSRSLMTLQERLNPPMTKSSRVLKNKDKGNEAATEEITGNSRQKTSSDTNIGKLPSRMWIAWVLLIIVLLSTIVLLLRTTIKQRR